MKTTSRRTVLTLLIGAALLAALAIGVAVLFQPDGAEPAAQTNAPSSVNGAEPIKEAHASDSMERGAQEETSEISPRLAKLLQA